MNLPFAESAEQNKAVIFDAIRPYLKGEVLEVGSGTGQHAVFYAGQLPDLRWQTSDLAANLPGIAARIAACTTAKACPSGPLRQIYVGGPSRSEMYFRSNSFSLRRRFNLSSFSARTRIASVSSRLAS